MARSCSGPTGIAFCAVLVSTACGLAPSRLPPSVPSAPASTATAGGAASVADVGWLPTNPALIAAARLCSEVLDLDAEHPCEAASLGLCWPYVAVDACASGAPTYPDGLGTFVAFCRHGGALPPASVSSPAHRELLQRHDCSDGLALSPAGSSRPPSHPRRRLGPGDRDRRAGDVGRQRSERDPEPARGSFDVAMLAQGLAMALEDRAVQELEHFVGEKLGTLFCGPPARELVPS